MVLSLTLAAVAALLPYVGAQTFSACNPLEKTDCPPNPAITENFQCNFKDGEKAINGWKITSGALSYKEDGAQFTINKRFDSPTIQTNGYFLFGRAEVKTKAAPGQGIISSIVLQSEALDEVDWEFIGGVNTEVQSNYFGKGNTTTYDRMNRHPVTTPQQIAHTYIIDWTAERIEFYIDDAKTPIRTLKFLDANGGKNYPQTPMNLRIGIWAGGDKGNSPGTIEWAGGETDYNAAPWTQVLESVKVTNYSPGKEYIWTDQTGSYESITVVAGEPQTGSPDKPVESLSSRAAAPPVESSPVSAGSPDSPGGLGGGNGGNTVPGEFFPSPTAGPDQSTCSSTSTVTVTSTLPYSTDEPAAPTSDVAPTVITPSAGEGIPTGIIIDTGSPTPPSSPAVTLIPTIPITNPSPTRTPPATFSGAAAVQTGLGGYVLAAGVLGAFFV